MITLRFRDTLPPNVVDELDNVLGKFKGIWLTEHDQDGSHTDIHAHSVAVTKDTTKGWTGDVSAGGNVVAQGVGTFGGDVTANSGASSGIAWESKLSGSEGNASMLGPALDLGGSAANFAWRIVANTLKGASPGSQGSLEFVRVSESGAFRRAMRLSQADTPAAGEYYLVPSVAGKLFLGATASLFADAGRITKMWATDVDSTNVITNSVTFPATQVASAGANTLDDYEEGTFIPQLSSDGGGSTTYAVQVGSYIKIGRFCFISGRIILGVNAFAAGNIYITGMPFNVGGAAFGGGTCVFYATLNIVTQSVNFYLSPGVNYGNVTLGQNGGSILNMQAADLVNGSDLLFQGWYITDN